MVIAVSQIMFCRDLTECLSTAEDSVLDAVKEAEQRCFQVSVIVSMQWCMCGYS